MPVCGALAAGISTALSMFHRGRVAASPMLVTCFVTTFWHCSTTLYMFLFLVLVSSQNAAFCGLRCGSLPGVKDSCEISIWKVSCDGTMDEPEVEAAESAEPGSGMMKLWLFSSLTES